MKHPKLTKFLLAGLIGFVLLVIYLIMINLLAYMVESDTSVQEMVKHSLLD
jgi:uncharacterized membrane protein YesL